jgi:EmrB/QacA subfamily drug resistance transporter
MNVSRPAVALTVLVGCQLMVGLDGTVVAIALPAIRGGLGFSATALPWVVTAYALAFGGLLLLGGRAGDLLGRRRMLRAGVAVFTAASLAGGLAPTAGVLLAARVVQGAGAAVAAPSALALLATVFSGPARVRALALFSAAAGGSLALGLVLGGTLTGLSWRWVMFVTVPIGAAVLVLAPRVLPEPARRPVRLDVPGAVLATAATTSLTYGLLHAASAGWSSGTTVLALVLGVALLGGLVAVEARVAEPLLPPRLLADRMRAGAYTVALLVPAGMYATFFFLTQYTQDVLGYRPVRAGLAFLPMALAMVAATRLVPAVLRRTGPRAPAVAGPLTTALGLAWLTGLTPESGYAAAVLGPLVLVGLGIGATFAPLAAIVLGSVPAEDAGAASGVLQTLQWSGASLGLAVLATRGSAHAAFGAAAVLVAVAGLVAAITLRPARVPVAV